MLSVLQVTQNQKVYLVKDRTLLKPENNAMKVLNPHLLSWDRNQTRWDNRSQTRGLHRQTSIAEQNATSGGRAECQLHTTSDKVQGQNGARKQLTSMGLSIFNALKICTSLFFIARKQIFWEILKCLAVETLSKISLTIQVFPLYKFSSSTVGKQSEERAITPVTTNDN